MQSLLPALQQTVTKLISDFDTISNDRKLILKELTDFVTERKKSNQRIDLNFICTHNSRRSHMAQIWAQAAAYYYGIGNIQTYSGGTEATAFNPKAVSAMKFAGFEISIIEDGANPKYGVQYSSDASALTVFSKKYDDAFNASKDFAAVMTCSHADENCPLIIGAAKRIALTYDDPKNFDGTPQESEKYLERVYEIGREILFAFSQVK